MQLSDFDYTLPEELIAQKPAEKREASRLMVIDTVKDKISHGTVADITDYLSADDLIVVNNTRVFPARLIGNKTDSGGEAEIFLLTPRSDRVWNALCRPARRLKIGTAVSFNNGLLQAEIIEKGDKGHVVVELKSEIPIDEAIDRCGKTPLPPYIKRDAEGDDVDRYQTVYAEHRGSVAAPTAGLHFSESILKRIADKGIAVETVVLHVGIGTFRPLNEDEIGKDHLHSEYCSVPEATVAAVNTCRERGGRVFVVGTTTARALESASRNGSLEKFEGWTDIFIKPPYDFKSVDCLMTNFHLPKSSLLMMVSAFAGREKILAAYEEAVRERYRFYSYGDAMLILR